MALLKILSGIPIWALLVLVIGLSMAIAWGLVTLVRQRFGRQYFKENNEFVGFTYAVYGLIYGVVLAFTIVTAWTGYNEAEYVVMKEAAVVNDLWRDADAFPPAPRAEIHRDLRDYVTSAVDQEWQTIANTRSVDPATQAIIGRLWMHSYDVNPATPNQVAFFSEYLTHLNELSGQRLLRLIHSRAQVSGVLWLVLLAGAVPTLAYALLFETKHRWVHVTVTSFITGLVLLCLLVTFFLQYPFSGAVAIEPGPLKELKQALEQRAMADAAGRPGERYGQGR